MAVRREAVSIRYLGLSHRHLTRTPCAQEPQHASPKADEINDGKSPGSVSAWLGTGFSSTSWRRSAPSPRSPRSPTGSSSRGRQSGARQCRSTASSPQTSRAEAVDGAVRVGLIDPAAIPPGARLPPVWLMTDKGQRDRQHADHSALRPVVPGGRRGRAIITRIG